MESRSQPDQIATRRFAYGGIFVFAIVLLLTSLPRSVSGVGVPHASLVSKILVRGEPTIESRVDKILSETPLIDGHIDLPYFLRWSYSDAIYSDNFTNAFEDGTLGGDVDLARLRKGKVGGFFWSIYVDCPKGNSTPAYLVQAQAEADSAIDVSLRLQEKYPHAFGMPRDSSDILKIFESGRIVSPLGVEGLHVLGDSFAKLRDYYARGVRYATLTHNCNNAYADAALVDLPDGSSVPATPQWNGVSSLGRTLIREMNRLGILVDLSHVSADTMRTALGAEPKGNSSQIGPKLPSWEGSLAPPIFSHSSAFAICPHPRNVPDDVLQLLKSHDGVVMVNFWRNFISCFLDSNGVPTPYPANATISQIVRHMRYIGDLVGYDHVGVGSDFDGVPEGVPDLENVSKYPNLIAEMLKQGITDSDAKKIVGGNLVRVWKKADAVSKNLRKSGALPAEDILSSVPNPFA